MNETNETNGSNEMNCGRNWHGKWNHFSPLAIVGMIAGGLALAVVFAFALGWFVMLLWNYLMPGIFGLPLIGFWQAWGLVLLAHILIKPGYGGHGHGRGMHRFKHGPRVPCGRNGDWREEMKAQFKDADKTEE